MYAWVTQIRNYFFDQGIFKASEFDFPIINVGNLAVGGSGKTPHIEYLIRLLSADFQVATLSRGYGRKTKGYREVNLDSLPTESGDEPLQIKTNFPQVNVFVGEDRVEAVTQLLFYKPDTEVILLDDAYQHRAIKAGFNILLTDYSKIFTRDKSMPFGRLREFPSASKRADMIIISKCPNQITEDQKTIFRNEIGGFSSAPILFSEITYGELFPFNTSGFSHSGFDEVLIVSGLANPTPMVQYIKQKFGPNKLEHLSFRDHHQFTQKDLVTIIEKFNKFASQNKILVISEKDAVRLREISENTDFEKLPVFVLPIKISFLGENKNIFNQAIKHYVRENKADNSIYSKQDQL